MARLRTVKGLRTRSAQSPPTKTPLFFAYEDKGFSYFGHIINIFYLYMESTYCGLQLFYDLPNYNVSCLFSEKYGFQAWMSYPRLLLKGVGETR